MIDHQQFQTSGILKRSRNFYKKNMKRKDGQYIPYSASNIIRRIFSQMGSILFLLMKLLLKGIVLITVKNMPYLVWWLALKGNDLSSTVCLLALLE